jgi:hypothetical protein
VIFITLCVIADPAHFPISARKSRASRS